MSKIKLNLAISLDGYIARLDNSYDFLNENEMNEESEKDFETFVDGIDVLIMGSTSYDQFEEQGGNPFSNKFTYVLTSQEYADEKNVLFTDMEILDLDKAAKEKADKDIWLFGGAKVVKQFIDLDLIDEYIITIVPKIIGTGIPLFLFSDKDIDLELVETKHQGGNVTLHYIKK
jgi:dihydrofolate reductase